MAVEVFMPKMSDHMESGEIVCWLAGEGDQVAEGQSLVEIVTDKATGEIEAPTAGVLKGIRAGAGKGAQVRVGETIAFIAREDEQIPALAPLDPGGPGSKDTGGDAATEGAGLRRVKASPAARRRAGELGLDLSRVAGNGPGGLVREADVDSLLRVSSSVKEAGTASFPDDSSEGGVSQWIELSQIERYTGERMLESVSTAPQFSLAARVDVEKLLWLRDMSSEHEQRLSVTALLVKIVAHALTRHPRANSSYRDGRLRLYSEVNVGVAVGGSKGLVVPVVHNADRKSASRINDEVRRFAVLAGDMRFDVEELSGGTFTISNLGMYGVERFDAIVNPPQCCILSVGCIVDTPAGAGDGRIVLRPMMYLTLTVDHRCMDGLQAAQFLGTIKGMIEVPRGFFASRGPEAAGS